jgi:hypothetical protein
MSDKLRMLLKRRHITNKVHIGSSVNPTELKIHSQNILGLKDESKIETIINIIGQEILYAYCVQETFLQGYFTLELNHGSICIHHGPEVHPSRCGRGGVKICLGQRAANYWSIGGSKITKGGLSIGDMMRYMTITLNTSKLTVINYNSITLVSNYIPDSRSLWTLSQTRYDP